MPNVFETLKERGFVSQVTDEPGLRELLQNNSITCYIGFDPTAPTLHAGSLLPLMALSHLQRSGHRTIAIVGGGTAMVGDPSGKTELRKMLSTEQIKANTEKLKTQIGRFIDLDGKSGLLLDNAQWLLPLQYIPFLRDIGKYFSVNRMLSFESYKIRLEKGLSFLEFNYQLLQAYDFLVLFQKQNCVLQLGGDDQWGNIVAGMDLIRRVESKPAYGLTFPLLQKASGEKMGKTAGGALWLDPEKTSPYEFYQYFRNTDDRDVGRFLGFFTYLPMDEVRELEGRKDSELNQAKEVLAYEATCVVHGQDAAQKARQASQSAFGATGCGLENVPTSPIARSRLEAGILVVDLLAEVGLCSSKSEARRLVSQGGARIGEHKVLSLEEQVTFEQVPEEGILLRAGKKKVQRIVVH